MVLCFLLLAFECSKNTKLCLPPATPTPTKAQINKMPLVALLRLLLLTCPGESKPFKLACKEGSSQVCQGLLEVLGKQKQIKPAPPLKHEKPHSNRFTGNEMYRGIKLKCIG